MGAAIFAFSSPATRLPTQAASLSNHRDLEPVTTQFGIPFHFVPVPPGEKQAAEKKESALLDANEIDLIVFARYMQIVSPDFVWRHPYKIINIHHSFLPAFVGQKPYHQAHERGVKLIGATVHYATAELDQGPIFDQDVTRISHRDDVDDLIRKGRDLERVVLARAVRRHLEGGSSSSGTRPWSSTERDRPRSRRPEGTKRSDRDRTVAPGRLHTGACRIPLA